MITYEKYDVTHKRGKQEECVQGFGRKTWMNQTAYYSLENEALYNYYHLQFLNYSFTWSKIHI
jgi:hypothetical protein